MKYLLDTSTFIWFADGDNQLSNIGRERIEDSENTIFVSIISLWEIVIKQRLNKLDFSADVSQMMLDVQMMDAQLLGLEPRHLQALEILESPPDHKDPFDRLLISQALADNLSIMSSDGKFPLYPVNLVW